MPFNLFHILKRKPKATAARGIFDEVLKLHLHSNFQFIQIGANDGIQEDPIRKYILQYQWKGILVEPVPEYFEKLVVNYKGSNRLIFENAAIDVESGYKKIFRVKDYHESAAFRWKNGIASFNPDHHKLSGTRSDEIEPIDVRVMTFSDLLKKHQIIRLDLLQIDAEGYDVKILTSVDFSEIKPAIIRFEHNLLAGTHSRDEVGKAIGLLMSKGYNISADKSDCLAYLDP